MAQSVGSTTNAAAQGGGHDEGHSGQRLGSFLCWAVVFADIGTSVYYVPGILYGQVNTKAGLFVLMTLVVFILLTLKYAEVSVRFPEGGGVVTVAARGLNPWAGAIGGMFILVDYFLTAAISSLSGLQYFSNIVPAVTPYVLPITLGVLVGLGVLNWWGIKESAMVSAAIAIAALTTDAMIIFLVMIHLPLSEYSTIIHMIFSGSSMSAGTLLTGYAGAFLAFSGLESISQLSPVMRVPRQKTVSLALALVAITVGISGPVLTIFATTLLKVGTMNADQQGQLISILGGVYGGDALRITTAVAASALLIFASNTAIIGAYHVFLALSRMRFFPAAVSMLNRVRHTPHFSIALATGIPIVVLLAVAGDVNTLGDMYAFGLLGAFSLTCIALDVMRMRERRSYVPGEIPDYIREDIAEGEAEARARNHATTEYPAGSWRAWLRQQENARLSTPESSVARTPMEAATPARPSVALVGRLWPDFKYYIGFATTALVVIAWVTNLYSKPLATGFGGGLTALGVGIAIINYRHQKMRGYARVLPSQLVRKLYAVPDAVLAVLPSGDPANNAVVQAAIDSAAGRPVVFLALGEPTQRPPRLFEIEDPYLNDTAIYDLYAHANSQCRRDGVEAFFIYRLALPTTVRDVWRVIRPAEVIAADHVAKRFAEEARPEYVRYSLVDGVRVAHSVTAHHGPSERPIAPGTVVKRPVHKPAVPSDVRQPVVQPAVHEPEQSGDDADGQPTARSSNGRPTGTGQQPAIRNTPTDESKRSTPSKIVRPPHVKGTPRKPDHG